MQLLRFRHLQSLLYTYVISHLTEGTRASEAGLILQRSMGLLLIPIMSLNIERAGPMKREYFSLNNAVWERLPKDKTSDMMKGNILIQVLTEENTLPSFFSD